MAMPTALVLLSSWQPSKQPRRGTLWDSARVYRGRRESHLYSKALFCCPSQLVADDYIVVCASFRLDSSTVCKYICIPTKVVLLLLCRYADDGIRARCVFNTLGITSLCAGRGGESCTHTHTLFRPFRRHTTQPRILVFVFEHVLFLLLVATARRQRVVSHGVRCL